MTEFIIPYPTTKKGRNAWSREYGLNAIYAGKHWSKRQADSQFWHRLVYAELRRQGIEKNIYRRPVEITMYWNDRLDIDNHAYMGKMIVDALKQYILEDDSRRWLKGVTHRFHDKDYVRVIVD